MKKYISHYSAAMAWNIPYIETVLGSKITESDSSNITVSKYNARFFSKDNKIYSCELDLPVGAVIVRNGRAIASPELLFLELASELSIHSLILLGLELCSHPQAQPSKAITTRQKLAAFLEKTSGHRGHYNATRAVKYVENGSASIMESLAYMILTLPHALGGYGLNSAVFNHEISLKSEARAHLKQNYCYVDLYYKRAKLAVEYESFTHHSSPLEQSKDMVRSDFLESQGIYVMHMSTIQLYDIDACRNFAYNLARRLKKRMQIRSKRFNEMHALIRALLPDKKDVPCPTKQGL